MPRLKLPQFGVSILYLRDASMPPLRWPPLLMGPCSTASNCPLASRWMRLLTRAEPGAIGAAEQMVVQRPRLETGHIAGMARVRRGVVAIRTRAGVGSSVREDGHARLGADRVTIARAAALVGEADIVGGMEIS